MEKIRLILAIFLFILIFNFNGLLVSAQSKDDVIIEHIKITYNGSNILENRDIKSYPYNYTIHLGYTDKPVRIEVKISPSNQTYNIYNKTPDFLRLTTDLIRVGDRYWYVDPTDSEGDFFHYENPSTDIPLISNPTKITLNGKVQNETKILLKIEVMNGSIGSKIANPISDKVNLYITINETEPPIIEVIKKIREFINENENKVKKEDKEFYNKVLNYSESLWRRGDNSRVLVNFLDKYKEIILLPKNNSKIYKLLFYVSLVFLGIYSVGLLYYRHHIKDNIKSYRIALTKLTPKNRKEIVNKLDFAMSNMDPYQDHEINTSKTFKKR